MAAAEIPFPFAKRILDVTIAGALVLILSPVLLVAAVAAVLASGGVLFHREQRISRGRRFELLKFKTLRRDVQGEPRIAERDPSNLTWAGRLLLKPWYLDELPQLFNVLRGDISLVGPRPWTPDMVEQQVAKGFDYRLHIVAGLTGPAQITKGIPDTDYRACDLEYVSNCRKLGGSALVRYDLGILVRTLRVIARREGLSY